MKGLNICWCKTLDKYHVCSTGETYSFPLFSWTPSLPVAVLLKPCGAFTGCGEGGRLRVRSRDQGFARGQNHRLLNSNYPQFFCLQPTFREAFKGSHISCHCWPQMVLLYQKRRSKRKSNYFHSSLSFVLLCPSDWLREIFCTAGAGGRQILRRQILSAIKKFRKRDHWSGAGESRILDQHKNYIS